MPIFTSINEYTKCLCLSPNTVKFFTGMKCLKTEDDVTHRCTVLWFVILGYINNILGNMMITAGLLNTEALRVSPHNILYNLVLLNISYSYSFFPFLPSQGEGQEVLHCQVKGILEQRSWLPEGEDQEARIAKKTELCCRKKEDVHRGHGRQMWDKKGVEVWKQWCYFAFEKKQHCTNVIISVHFGHNIKWRY